MPTYLSPGVYVEEVEAGSRPIEGVGTAVAAFVGLAAAGPGQRADARHQLEPVHPDLRRLRRGLVPRPRRLRLLPERRRRAYVVRVGARRRTAPTARGRAARRPTRRSRRLPRSRALEAGAGRQRHHRRGRPTPSRTSRRATRSSSSSSRAARSSRSSTTSPTKRGKQQRRHRGQRRSRSSIQLEEVRPAAPSSGPRRARSTLGRRRRRRPGARRRPTTTSATPPTAPASAASRRSTRSRCSSVPDLMAAYQQGMIDLEGVQAVQLAMIAHCELMGDRVAILDPPPGLNAQQVKEWRVDKAGYDSKYATLYWPWVKVFDPSTGQSDLRPAVAATSPASGRRNDDTRGVHKAPANEVVRGAIALELNITKAEHDLLNPDGINCIRAFPGRGHPGLGRPHAVERPGVALPQRPPAVQLRRGVDPRAAPSGSSSSRTTTTCGPSVRRTINAFLRRRCGATARCSARRPTRRSSSSATTRPTRPRSIDAGQLDRRDRHRPGEAGRVRRLPPRPVLRRRSLVTE